MHLGPLSKLRQLLADEGEPEQYEAESQIASLEAQGIMVYDTASGGESHVSFPNLLW